MAEHLKAMGLTVSSSYIHYYFIQIWCLIYIPFKKYSDIKYYLFISVFVCVMFGNMAVYVLRGNHSSSASVKGLVARTCDLVF